MQMKSNNNEGHEVIKEITKVIKTNKNENVKLRIN